MNDPIFKPSATVVSKAKTSKADYETLYAQSIKDPEGFWREQAKRLDWFSFPKNIRSGDFQGDARIGWFDDGVLNVCYNCVDRHLLAKANDTAIIFEEDEPHRARRITYAQLHAKVCRLANALRSLGVKKGDRVTIYMPMIPQAAAAMLACARIGAVHSVVFGGFSPESLRSRIADSNSKVLLTADEGLRGGKKIHLKANVDEALAQGSSVQSVVVLRHTGAKIKWEEGRDHDWETLCEDQNDQCPCEPMNAEDPLFILYTSGSTGAPKGVVHTTGGYLLYASLTHDVVFDYQPGEVYWCTADIGWVTGHSYVVYGPLCNGAVTLIYEGVPQHPDYGRLWQIVDEHKVNIFYTAPTAIRALLSAGDEWVKKSSRQSLRVLASVGEPINHEAWMWYYRVVGEERCPVIDTWWQTETGGHMITPLVSFDLKPGSATLPFFGVQPVLVDQAGKVLEGATEGNLCIAASWPGQARTVYGDHDRFVKTYFSTYGGLYFTGDGARRDADGYYWITGRVDDVINVSGHRLGTAEIESAINEHPLVAESAVVGYPHDIKGQGIYAYVTLLAGHAETPALRAEIVQTVRRIIGPIASPDVIQIAAGLPKTRSGKIMRRILRKIAAGETDSLGDTSTLADPGVADDLIKNARK